VGFGSELLFLLLLGLLVIGPKRLPTIMARVARAKAQFDKATGSLRSQLQAELEVPLGNEGAEVLREAVRQ
jgi:Sec-independent protein translocase protein TatA